MRFTTLRPASPRLPAAPPLPRSLCLRSAAIHRSPLLAASHTWPLLTSVFIFAYAYDGLQVPADVPAAAEAPAFRRTASPSLFSRQTPRGLLRRAGASVLLYTVSSLAMSRSPVWFYRRTFGAGRLYAARVTTYGRRGAKRVNIPQQR
jgi:hypothetical protein